MNYCIYDKEKNEVYSGERRGIWSGVQVMMPYCQVSLSSGPISALESTVDTRRHVMRRDPHDCWGKTKPKISDFTSSNEVMQMFMNHVEQVASGDSLLLIMGETGARSILPK